VRISFGGFTLDLETRRLTSAGQNIHLEPKAFELLSMLILERPKALSKAVLQERLWPRTFVAEANLSNLIGEIRAALGDSARASKFVRTIHGFGYAFCGEAVPLTDSGDALRARTALGSEDAGPAAAAPTVSPPSRPGRVPWLIVGLLSVGLMTIAVIQVGRDGGQQWVRCSSRSPRRRMLR
jgi:DNA-binding winged helix-turn-helix (wHTH) protein